MAQRGTKWTPRPSKIEPRRSKMALLCQVVIRTRSQELARRVLEAILSEVGRARHSNIVKNHWIFIIFVFFLEGDFVAQDAPKRRRAGVKIAQRHQGVGPGGGLRRGYMSLRSWTARRLARRSAERRRIFIRLTPRYRRAIFFIN